MTLLWPAMRVDAAIRRRLPDLWTLLLKQGLSITIENLEQPGRLEGFGLSALVESSVADRYLHEPRPYLPARFYRALIDGRAAALTAEQIRRANSADGVDVLVLHFGMCSFDFADPRTQQVLAIGSAGFYFTHGGYRVRTLQNEVYGAAGADFMQQGGFRLVRNFAAERPADFAGLPESDRPYLFALHRDWMQPAAVNPLAQLFFPPPPRILYSDTERQVLEMALLNESDQQIAAALGVSADTIKKLWRKIFARTGRVLPHLAPAEEAAARGVRGREKRSYVLDYLRVHLEELRPYARRSETGAKSFTKDS